MRSGGGEGRVTLPANRVVAAAALGRAVLLGRAALTLTAAGVGLRVLPDPRTALAVLVVESVVVLCGLVAGRGGVPCFCFAAGACALGVVLRGMRGLVLWAPHA